MMGIQAKKGDIVKIHKWHEVVLNVFLDDAGGQVLQVQTVRNVFRGYGPEFIEMAVTPDAIELASREDLDKEIRYFTKMREIGLNKMLEVITQDSPSLAQEAG